MPEWELTDAEKAQLRDRLIDEFSEEGLSFLRTIDEGAEAQAKKLVEWQSSDCLNHKHNLTPRWRCRCWECMEELRRQVGLE